MWSHPHESYLKSIAERCASREVMHLSTHRCLARQCAWFKIPTIFISLIGGSAQASQESLDKLIGSESFTPWLPIILGMLSLFVSLLNSVSSYLQVESLSQQHLSSSIMFGKLCRQISKEVRLDRKDRSLGGGDAMKQYGMQFDQLLEQAPPLSRKIEKAFAKRRDTRKLRLSVPPSIRIDPIYVHGDESKVMSVGAKKSVRQLASLFGNREEHISDTTTVVSSGSSDVRVHRQNL